MASKITVGCKLPHGLIMDMGDKRVTLKGANSSGVIGGHGVTEGVDSDFYNAWMKKNASLEFVKRGFIFANEKPSEVAAEAADLSKEKTGFEALTRSDLPKGVEPATA